MVIRTLKKIGMCWAKILQRGAKPVQPETQKVAKLNPLSRSSQTSLTNPRYPSSQLEKTTCGQNLEQK